MANIDLLSIQPHKVSRDLRGYSVFVYGDAKSGKTTLASKFPDSLLLAFEKGYNALPGIMVQPINSWGEFRKVLTQLKKPEVQQKFSTIIIDTADIAWDLCEKYICDNVVLPNGQVGVDSIGDIPYGAGYTKVGKEFDECLRQILQLNYGEVLISHATDKTFKDESGKEFNQIVPTLSAKPRNIVYRMCDIVGYSRIITDESGKTSSKLFMRGTSRFMAGSRFKYTPEVINLNYKELVDAIANAIDQQAKEEGEDLFTDTRENSYINTTADLDFDVLMKEFQTIINNAVEKYTQEVFAIEWNDKVVQITEKYLGKGNKVSKCSRDQVEALDLIVTDLRELFK